MNARIILQTALQSRLILSFRAFSLFRLSGCFAPLFEWTAVFSLHALPQQQSHSTNPPSLITCPGPFRFIVRSSPSVPYRTPIASVTLTAVVRCFQSLGTLGRVRSDSSAPCGPITGRSPVYHCPLVCKEEAPITRFWPPNTISRYHPLLCRPIPAHPSTSQQISTNLSESERVSVRIPS